MAQIGPTVAEAVPNANNPTNSAQWAQGYIDYLVARHGGTPASGPNDPRVKFLVKWINVEATFGLGYKNPLDTSQPAAGSHSINNLGNGQGVQAYPYWEEGYAATEQTMLQGFDTPILKELLNGNATNNSLGVALAKSNWSGSGAGSIQETGYASTIAGASPQISHVSAGTLAAGKPGSSGGSPPTIGPNYTGPGAWIIQLDGAVNPAQASPGVLAQVLGPLDLSTDTQKLGGVAEMLFVRGGLALLSLGVFAAGISLVFGKDIISAISGRGRGLGTAEAVSQLATERAAASASAASSRQAARDSAAERRERLRQESIDRRERERHSLSLDRLQKTAQARERETKLVGARSRARVRAEGATAERVRQQRLHTQARARAKR